MQRAAPAAIAKLHCLEGYASETESLCLEAESPRMVVEVVSRFGVAFLSGLWWLAFLSVHTAWKENAVKCSYKATGPVGLWVSFMIIVLNHLFMYYCTGRPWRLGLERNSSAGQIQSMTLSCLQATLFPQPSS